MYIPTYRMTKGYLYVRSTFLHITHKRVQKTFKVLHQLYCTVQKFVECTSIGVNGLSTSGFSFPISFKNGRWYHKVNTFSVYSCSCLSHVPLKFLKLQEFSQNIHEGSLKS